MSAVRKLTQRGEALYNSGNYGEAREFFEQALAQCEYERVDASTLASLKNNLANCLVAQNELARAEELYKQALDSMKGTPTNKVSREIAINYQALRASFEQEQTKLTEEPRLPDKVVKALLAEGLDPFSVSLETQEVLEEETQGKRPKGKFADTFDNTMGQLIARARDLYGRDQITEFELHLFANILANSCSVAQYCLTVESFNGMLSMQPVPILRSYAFMSAAQLFSFLAWQADRFSDDYDVDEETLRPRLALCFSVNAVSSIDRYFEYVSNWFRQTMSASNSPPEVLISMAYAFLCQLMETSVNAPPLTDTDKKLIPTVLSGIHTHGIQQFYSTVYGSDVPRSS